MENISVVILTKDEENNILDCIESVKNASEIIIIDDYSTDRTLEVVKTIKNTNIKVFQHHLSLCFSEQRNFGLSKAKNEWIMFLDADERVSPALNKEISSFNLSISNLTAFYIKRVDVMWGRELKYGETGNIKFIRLAKKSAGKWKNDVHEVWNVKGEVGYFNNPLMHYPHPTISEFISEINFYSTLRAEELHKEKMSVSLLSIILYFKAKFFVNYFLKLGFLDGLPGLIFALMMSLHSFLVRSKLWLLTNHS